MSQRSDPTRVAAKILIWLGLFLMVSLIVAAIGTGIYFAYDSFVTAPMVRDMRELNRRYQSVSGSAFSSSLIIDANKKFITEREEDMRDETFPPTIAAHKESMNRMKNAIKAEEALLKQFSKDMAKLNSQSIKQFGISADRLEERLEAFKNYK
jgi:hypothetical protein